jgi:hypothetical protein
VADAGLDYSQRTNKLAHHIALMPTELNAPGPAWALGQSGLMETAWSGDPRILPSGRSLPGGVAAPRFCNAWQQAKGDAGWAGVVADAMLDTSSRKVYLIYRPGLSILPLLAEVEALLPEAVRWQFTFSTYYANLPPDVNCRCRCVLADTPDAMAASRQPGVLVVDLQKTDEPAPQSAAADAARNGTGVGRMQPVRRLPESVPAQADSPHMELMDDPNANSVAPAGTKLLAGPPILNAPQGALPPPTRPPRVSIARPPAKSKRRRSALRIVAACAGVLLFGAAMAGMGYYFAALKGGQLANGSGAEQVAVVTNSAAVGERVGDSKPKTTLQSKSDKELGTESAKAHGTQAAEKAAAEKAAAEKAAAEKAAAEKAAAEKAAAEKAAAEKAAAEKAAADKMVSASEASVSAHETGSRNPSSGSETGGSSSGNFGGSAPTTGASPSNEASIASASFVELPETPVHKMGDEYIHGEAVQLFYFQPKEDTLACSFVLIKLNGASNPSADLKVEKANAGGADETWEIIRGDRKTKAVALVLVKKTAPLKNAVFFQWKEAKAEQKKELESYALALSIGDQDAVIRLSKAAEAQPLTLKDTDRDRGDIARYRFGSQVSEVAMRDVVVLRSVKRGGKKEPPATELCREKNNAAKCYFRYGPPESPVEFQVSLEPVAGKQPEVIVRLGLLLDGQSVTRAKAYESIRGGEYFEGLLKKFEDSLDSNMNNETKKQMVAGRKSQLQNVIRELSGGGLDIVTISSLSFSYALCGQVPAPSGRKVTITLVERRGK